MNNCYQSPPKIHITVSEMVVGKVRRRESNCRESKIPPNKNNNNKWQLMFN